MQIRALPPSGQFLIKLALGLFIILFTPSGGTLVGPGLMFLFWIILTSENRTITLSTIILATGIGLIGFIPVATILEIPWVLIFGKQTIFAVVFSMGFEVLLIVSVLTGLSVWRKSRLRYTGSILDFAIIGMSLGVGFECGIGVLYPSVAGHQGITLGMLPQLPGMLGHSSLPVACSSPAIWGMVFGLLVGVGRYLIGPDLNGSWLRRGSLIAIAVLLLLWIIGERVGYISGPPSGFWGVLYWVDLKGRLLAYLTGLLTMIAILVEWLLLQERPQAASLKDPWRALREAWNPESKISIYNRLLRIIRLQERRGLMRELVLAEEVKPVLQSEDLKRLEQRTIKVRQLLAKEGS